MTVPTLFEGELQYVGFTDSSRAGPCLKFRLHDRDELQKFIGLDARRVAAVLVLIGDDEQPETPPSAAKPEPATEKQTKKRGAGLTFLAVQWCDRPEFHEWLRTVYPAAFWSAEKTQGEAPEIAAEVIRVMCGIKSRAELDTDKKAAETFERAFRGPFRQYLQDGS